MKIEHLTMRSEGHADLMEDEIKELLAMGKHEIGKKLLELSSLEIEEFGAGMSSWVMEHAAHLLMNETHE